MARLRRSSLLCVLFTLFALVVSAQNKEQIGPCPFDMPLIEPTVIEAKDGKIETSLVVEMRTEDVPVWQNVAPGGKPPDYKCKMQKMNLRMYGWPSPTSRTSRTFDFPGPTYRLRKAKDKDSTGDSLAIKLTNNLPPGSNDQCNAGCVCPADQPVNQQARCCQAADVYPACFHGDNNTNLHFHGTHVSPQPPQDYVLLELRPANSPPVTAGSGTHAHGTVVNGTYDYKIDPFRWNQAPGTHWYHPHKHGSTALQVANGMAGTLQIVGQFDDQLEEIYKGKLRQHILVLQLVHELNFTTENQLATQPLINGQPSPVVEMYPGEIRRLRFVGATVQADGAVRVDFDSPEDNPVEIMQIAMDGVQFHPDNYERQPLVTQDKEFDLAPGNRADFLVKAPMATGRYFVTYELPVPDVANRKNNSNDHDLKEAIEQIAPGAAEPRLFIIDVKACPKGKTCEEMQFPTKEQFPQMPSYLSDITEEELSPPGMKFQRLRNLYFELEDLQGNRLGPDKIPSQPSKFFINLQPDERRQFNPQCVDITTRLDQAEEWTIANTSNRKNPKDPTAPIKPLHVFHIHTNPFQIVHHPLYPKLNTPPHVWQDSILLPNATQGPIKIRQRYEDFTGEYVLHCHFLGHEDRGMMLAVQTVCPDNVTKFGTPGSSQECVENNKLINAAPQCYPSPAAQRQEEAASAQEDHSGH